MSLNRYEDLKRFIHFADNTSQSDDKIRKVRPLVEELHKRYNLITTEEHVSTDEQIVSFKGRSCLRQYLPKKPHKWGYKLWVLCGASDYAYDFEVYTGKGKNVVQEGEADCGASGNVVIRLARSIPTTILPALSCRYTSLNKVYFQSAQSDLTVFRSVLCSLKYR